MENTHLKDIYLKNMGLHSIAVQQTLAQNKVVLYCD